MRPVTRLAALGSGRLFRLFVISLAAAALAVTPVVLAGTTELVSVSSAGELSKQDPAAPHDIHEPSISADGRFVVFASYAYNLVPGDTNECDDVFVRDRLLGITERVSMSSAGEQSNAGHCYGCSISADGRFVAFNCDASNLVPGDTNGRADVFVRDRLLGITELVSRNSAGEHGDSSSYFPSISADGRFVAFTAWATNLVPGDTNGAWDIFVRDRLLGMTERVSVSSTGEQGNHWSHDRPSLSADGRFVAFWSCASNLVPGDTNGPFLDGADVFVRDRLLGTTERVSVSSAGEQSSTKFPWPASISADGRFVAFDSKASNLVPGDTNGLYDIFVRDRTLGITERVSVSSAGEQANDRSWEPSISADGRFVALWCDASNLVPGYTDHRENIFVRDRLLGTTERVSVSSAGEPLMTESRFPTISADGRFVAFWSRSARPAPADTAGWRDVYVRDRGEPSRFADVPFDYWAYSGIEAIAAAGITAGCGGSPPLFCPAGSVTRAQMAIFLIRGMAETPCSTYNGYFINVPESHPWWSWIERIKELGITAGCVADDPGTPQNEAQFCPNDSVTRGQMAVFLCHALNLDYSNPPGTATFNDVPTDYWAYDWIEAFKDAGITAGTVADDPPTPENEAQFGPNDAVRRDQLAVFLSRAFGLL